MKKLFALLATAALATAGLVGAWSSMATASSPPPGELTLVHGIPGDGGFPVDIELTNLRTGDVATFDDVVFGTVAGPLEVPTGTWQAEISDSTGSTVLLAGELTLYAGQNKSAVAHLDRGGAPTLSVYGNNRATPIGEGTARVIVRHLAFAPCVDVLADLSATPEDEAVKLANGFCTGREVASVVPATDYEVSVSLKSDPTAVALQEPASLPEGSTVVVYAVGDLAGGTFTPLVQVL